MTIDENKFFRQAILRISSSLDIETAMQACMDYLKQSIPISGMIFGLYDPNLKVVKILASIWPETMQMQEKTISIPRELWGFAKRELAGAPKIKLAKTVALEQGDVGIRIINDVDKEPAEIRQALSLILPSDISFLRMNLEIDEERLGSFCMFTEGKDKYTDAHARLIALLHEPFAIALSNILQHQEILRLKNMLADDNRYLQQQMLEITGDTIIGANFGLKDVMKMVSHVSPLNSPVLLIGETGVGKEVLANAIHQSSARKNKPFIKVNCGAIPENLIDSELFGHEKGAFTGAISRKRGRFERAHTGTIFLDEIGELPLPAQVRLLRVLQEHEIERVGGTESILVDVRIISATHRNLEEMISSGEFREDLWFRLNVFPIIIPPLRQRAVDIPALVDHFLASKSKDLKLRATPPLAPGAIEKLQSYEWPGNVRELENLVERELIFNQMHDNKKGLSFDVLSGSTKYTALFEEGEKEDVIHPLDEVIKGYIQKALNHTNGKVEGKNGAAQLLGLHPSTLRGKMRKLGISQRKRGKK